MKKLIFSLICEINYVKSNIKINIQISPEYSINDSKNLYFNNHLTWCEKINKEEDFRFIHLLNGTLEEKIGTLNQIKLNGLVRLKDQTNPVIQYHL